MMIQLIRFLIQVHTMLRSIQCLKTMMAMYLSHRFKVQIGHQLKIHRFQAQIGHQLKMHRFQAQRFQRFIRHSEYHDHNSKHQVSLSNQVLLLRSPMELVKLETNEKPTKFYLMKMNPIQAKNKSTVK